MSRSRNGCTTCKRRHRECDETRPTCLNCKAHGVDCDGFDLVLRWEVGMAGRRHLTRSSPPNRFNSNLPNENSHLPSSDVPSRECVTSDDPAWDADGCETSLSTSASAIRPHQSLPPRLTEEQRRQEPIIVDEFFQKNVYQLYSTRRDDELPKLLHMLAQGSEALRAIVAGLHLYLEDPLDELQGFEPYQTRGLALFRRQLETYNGSLDASVLCTGLFICTISLYQGIPWSSLLNHMINVYELQRHLSCSMRELRQLSIRFAVEAMGIMDMPTFVRGRETMTNGIWTAMRSAQRDQGNDMLLGGVETLSSLPRSLLDIFAAIHDEDVETRFLAWHGEVGIVPSTHLWEAYRCAGVLTARRIGRACTHHGQGAERRNLGSEVHVDILMSRLIAALDALCETRVRPEYSAVLAINAMLYPLVAARLEVSALQRHPVWLARLREIQQVCQPYGGTANARHIAEMLDEAFETSDDGYDMDQQARKRRIEIALF